MKNQLIYRTRLKTPPPTHTHPPYSNCLCVIITNALLHVYRKYNQQPNTSEYLLFWTWPKVRLSLSNVGIHQVKYIQRICGSKEINHTISSPLNVRVSEFSSLQHFAVSVPYSGTFSEKQAHIK